MESMKVVSALDPGDAWCDVGRRLRECDPELYASVLISMSKHVELFEPERPLFDDSVIACILLAESRGYSF